MKELTTYNYYGSEYLGTIIPSNLFKKYNMKATSLINYFTFNRIKETDNDIKNACCEIAELLYQQENLYSKIINNGGEQVASETVGPYSKSYVNNSNIQKERLLTKKELDRECYQICLKYLADTGLMYRGGY